MSSPLSGTAERRPLERGLLTNAIGILVKASRPLYLVVFSRVLGAEGFGLYLLAFTVQEFVSKFAILGLNWGAKQLVGDLVSGGRDDRIRASVLRVLGITLLASGGVAAVLALAATTVAAMAGQPGIAMSIRIFACGFPFVCGMYVLVYSFRPRLDMRYELYVTAVVEPVGVLAIGVLLLSRAPSVEALACAHVAAAAIAFGAAWHCFGRLYRSRDARGTAAIDWRRLAHGSAAMGGMELVGNLQSRLDLLFLAQFYPPQVLGVYGAAGQIVSLLRKAKAAFDPILMPIAQDLHAQRDHARLQSAVTRAVGWATYVGLGLLGLVVLLAGPLLGIFGSDFAASGYGNVLVILAVGQFFYMSLGLGEGILAITGHAYATLVGGVVLVVLEMALLALLTPRWGLTGAALAASIPFVVVTLWRARQARRLLGVSLFTAGHARIVVAWLACIGLALVVAAVLGPDSRLGLAAAAAVFLLNYKTLGWTMGLGDDRSAAAGGR